MSCELNEGVPCEDCTRDYCPDMVNDALRVWYEIHSSIAYHEQKIEKLEYEKVEWLKEHKVLLTSSI